MARAGAGAGVAQLARAPEAHAPYCSDTAIISPSGGPEGCRPLGPRSDVPHTSSAERGQRAARECGVREQQVRNGRLQRNSHERGVASFPTRYGAMLTE